MQNQFSVVDPHANSHPQAIEIEIAKVKFSVIPNELKSGAGQVGS
jgi:hypothetical protein